MTGEVTLQGRVLPIGGVKQKVLAAHAAGLTDVVLPERNRGDLDDVPEEVRNAMTFHFAMTIDEVLAVALEPAPSAAPPGSLTTTLAPSAAQSSAISRPMPRPAPVTMMTLSCSDLLMGCLLLSLSFRGVRSTNYGAQLRT